MPAAGSGTEPARWAALDALSFPRFLSGFLCTLVRTLSSRRSGAGELGLQRVGLEPTSE